MGIHHDTGRNPQPDAQYHVRRFAADTGQFRKCLHRFGHLAAVIIHQAFGHGDQVFGLGLVETCRTDDRFKFFRVSGSQ
ncbi:hypothetical protein FGO68_gene14621 [Halteria grandinella]|uniref:Uncharacterized protein n=1 Tax=Halteria grandinella TaxID=5974 RepID=A0A8J8NI26_HALGN|nr:hypothetical protein FGO68_gene14621 [Halteria grandinella]